MKKNLHFALILGAAMLAADCESIDCALNNAVEMYCAFYMDGKAVVLNDTLTVTVCGSDSILLNRKVGASRFQLPLSFYNSTDSIVFHIKGNGYEVEDTVWIAKETSPHFETPECPTTMFHRITDVSCSNLFLEKVTVTDPDVNYAQGENIQIHFHSAD